MVEKSCKYLSGLNCELAVKTKNLVYALCITQD